MVVRVKQVLGALCIVLALPVGLGLLALGFVKPRDVVRIVLAGFLVEGAFTIMVILAAFGVSLLNR